MLSPGVFFINCNYCLYSKYRVRTRRRRIQFVHLYYSFLMLWPKTHYIYIYIFISLKVLRKIFNKFESEKGFLKILDSK